MKVLRLLDSIRESLQEAAKLLHVLWLPIAEVREVQERCQGFAADLVCQFYRTSSAAAQRILDNWHAALCKALCS